jgi:hypothetical protein
MSPETTRFRENLPAPQVAAEGLIEVRKEAFLRKLRTAKCFSFEARLAHAATGDSTPLTAR